MITSEKQHQAAKNQLKSLQASLKAPMKSGVAQAIAEAGKAQTQELIDEIQAEIDEYERIRGMRPSEIPIHSIDDLMVAPIRYRIASHLSIDAFARQVEISARQIARYESEQYKNSSVPNLKKIIERLNIHVQGEVKPEKTPTDSI